MPSEAEVRHLANIVVGQYGEDAETHAHVRAEVSMSRGDLVGDLRWRRIVKAIDGRRSDAPAGRGPAEATGQTR